MSNLDDKLREIVDYCSSAYYPEHEYGNVYQDQNREYLEEAVVQIKQVFADAGYTSLRNCEAESLAVTRSNFVKSAKRIAGIDD